MTRRPSLRLLASAVRNTPPPPRAVEPSPLEAWAEASARARVWPALLQELDRRGYLVRPWRGSRSGGDCWQIGTLEAGEFRAVAAVWAPAGNRWWWHLSTLDGSASSPIRRDSEVVAALRPLRNVAEAA